jgi:UDP-N-acetylmuramoyl-tripeptide--D-alanyl-D-alanine ligase
VRFTRQEIADAVGGALLGQDGLVVGASIDSRDLPPGALFVPIVGQRDGHDFIDSAKQAGAGAWLSSRPVEDRAERAVATEFDGEILVDDTTAALQRLGSYARRRMAPGVIGVTGSTGKTSTKDLIGAVLLTDGPAAVSLKSFNNELGVPLTLVNAPDDCRHAVIEMGARGPGHIAMLCEIALPTVGVVTNIGSAHRELFGSAEATAHAKGELFASLPADGTAVLNGDDAMIDVLRNMAKCSALTFSATGSGQADLVATGIRLDGELRPSFLLSTPWGASDVTLHARGLHQVENALAAAAATLALGFGLAAVVHGLGTEALSPWRMEFHRLKNGAIILNDAYNANPASMKAGLLSLSATSATRHIALLGTMAELGDDAASMHEEIAAFARKLGVEIVAVDETAYGSIPVAGIDAAVAYLHGLGAPGEGDAILVKGSRMAGLEKLAQRLVDEGGAA